MKKNNDRGAFAAQNDIGNFLSGNSPKSSSPYFGTGAMNQERSEPSSVARAASRTLSKF